MKIFYSWQTDAPRKTNKNFIYDTLLLAVKKVKSDMNISEAERDGIEVDQDTQGVLGSPDIVRVIFDKIAKSNLVIADVSLVGTGCEGKKHINSNVAIELGYTYGKLGDEVVLKIMNTHFGVADELPFDLRTRRRPVQYCLDPGADKKTIKQEQEKISGELAKIFEQYLKPTVAYTGSQHAEIKSKDRRGAFWNNNQPIVQESRANGPNPRYCTAGGLIYFRCIPHIELPELSSKETYDATASLQPLFSRQGYSRERNEWGAISYYSNDEGQLISGTQVFKNREIWAFDAYFCNLFTKPEHVDEQAKRYVPTGAVQADYLISLPKIRLTASSLGHGKNYRIEMGISQALGLHLAVHHRYWDRFPGPILQDEVFIQRTISAEQQTGEIMNAFWTKVFSEAGADVPSELVWRPNSKNIEG